MWNILVYHIREVTRRESKSGAVVKHQRKFVVLKTTSNVKGLLKSGTAPLYRSLVTSLHIIARHFCGRIFSPSPAMCTFVKIHAQ